MKIVIVGGGNAGCITALEWGFFGKKSWYGPSELEVELIYDPSIKSEPVGQGTATELTRLITSLDFDWYNNPIDATPKHGILFENWGKKNHKFINPFDSASLGMHFDPSKLQKYILNSGIFKVIEDRIDDLSTIDADFIFDCRGGKNYDTKNYNKLINPLTSCIIGRLNKRDHNQMWSRAVATPDGWTFIIPQTNNTTVHGYLYNNHVTDEITVRDNFNKLFNIEPDDMSRVINFGSYIAKEVISEHRIIKNGNKLAGFEPLEATAMSLHLQLSSWCNQFIVPYNVEPRALAAIQDVVEKDTLKYVHEIETFLLWHYKFGSKYDTPFWDYAKTMADNYFYEESFKNKIEFSKKLSLTDIRYMCTNFQLKSDQTLEIKGLPYTVKDVSCGPWSLSQIKNWYDNVAS